MSFKNLPLLLALLVVFGLLALTKKPHSTLVALPTTDNTAMTPTEAFHKMMDVLTHQRCVNCHPSDNVPKQGDDRHAHYFGVKRGIANMGYEATNCTTCHASENNSYSGVPGAPEWSLAPHSMRWEGLDRYEIAASMMDPERNGGRTPEETLHHLTEHELVLWAWNPGVNAEGAVREMPPVPLEEYREAVTLWFKSGHKIPTK